MTKLVVGTSYPRRDLAEKLTGETKYTSDIKLPGLLHGRFLRSPHPHARIVKVDVSNALKLEGVHSILTPFDVPDGRIAPDLPILDKFVRFVGDEVAAVAVDDEDIVHKALHLIDVEYEVLPFVINSEQALLPNAPHVHPEGNLVSGKPLVLTRGNVEEGLAIADRVFEETFTTSAHSGVALEPRAAIACWEKDQLTVWKTSRGIHADRATLALALNIPEAKVRVIGPPLGAGYGNKDETRLATVAAILAKRADRPVKMEFTREEEFVAGRHRHGTTTTLKVGIKNDGTVTAIYATTIMDTGAYLASGPGVVRRAGQCVLYLYRCPNVRYDGYLTYTNQPSAGSYRALGAPQGHFALEVLMDKIANELGIDPLEFRLKNHVGLEGQPGERITPTDQIVDSQPVEGGIPFSSNGLRECLNSGSKAIGWNRRKRLPYAPHEPKRVGMGMGMFIYRGGPGSKSRARLRLNSDGSFQLEAGIMDVGEGATTVLAQIAAQELGVSADLVHNTVADTSLTPDAPLTAGSTLTFSTGLSVKEAASRLRMRMLEIAAGLLGADVSQLAVRDGVIVTTFGPEKTMTIDKLASSLPDTPLEVNAEVVPGSNHYIVNSFGAHFAEVEVDIETGQVKILRYVAAHDSGNILNPTLAINQVEGGVSQMVGFTLLEEMITDNHFGATLNASYLEHKVPGIWEYPPVEVIFADVMDPVGPFGAKGLGELPSIGVAPAVVNAIYDAIGIRIHDLPVTPDKILNAIRLDRKRE